MSVMDVIFVLLLGLSVAGGLRQGARDQAVGLVSVVLSLGSAWVVLRLTATLPHPYRGVGAFVLLLAGLGGGVVLARTLLRRLGERQGSRVPDTADRVGGAFLSVGALLLAVWFLGVNLAAGPFASVASALRASLVVRSATSELPAPPRLMPFLETTLVRAGLPDAFVGLPPVPLPAVPSPDPAAVQRAAAAGLPSTVEVLGRGCIQGFFNEGSGFVVAPGYVLTNAHVVAGTHGQFVYDGRRHDATVVAMDPVLDLALLRTPSFRSDPLPLALTTPAQGSSGAVIGFPRTYPAVTSSAAVRGAYDVLAHDIYGTGTFTKPVIELQTDVYSGNSGGPFVLPDGSVAGVVFAASVLDPGVAYAIPSSALGPFVSRGMRVTGPVATGSCTNRG